MGKSTISMVIFNSYVWHNQAGYVHTHRIHGAGILMLTWLGYIDGIHVTINIAAPWIRHGICYVSQDSQVDLYGFVWK